MGQSFAPLPVSDRGRRRSPCGDDHSDVFLCFARRDLALLNYAQQLEQQKNWPAAQTAFETLSDNHRELASVGRENADRLKKLLDREKSIFARAQASEGSGDLTGAKSLYQQAADLHGTRNRRPELNTKLIPAEFPRGSSKRVSHVQHQLHR